MNYIAEMRCCVLLSVLFKRCGNDDAVGSDGGDGGGCGKTPQKLCTFNISGSVSIQMNQTFIRHSNRDTRGTDTEKERMRKSDREMEITIHRRCCILAFSAHRARQFVPGERCKVCNMWHFWLVFAVKIWIMTQSFSNMWILFCFLFFPFQIIIWYHFNVFSIRMIVHLSVVLEYVEREREKCTERKRKVVIQNRFAIWLSWNFDPD